MAIFRLMISVENLQAGRSLSIAFSDGVASWTLEGGSPRVAGLSLGGLPQGQLMLAGMALSPTTLWFTGGSPAGSLIIEAHIDLPDGTTAASGVTDTGGDTEVSVTCETGPGLAATLMGDWTISLA
jgi:hypothetical protein